MEQRNGAVIGFIAQKMRQNLKITTFIHSKYIPTMCKKFITIDHSETLITRFSMKKVKNALNIDALP